MSNPTKKLQKNCSSNPTKQTDKASNTWRFIKEMNIHWLVVFALVIGALNAAVEHYQW